MMDKCVLSYVCKWQLSWPSPLEGQARMYLVGLVFMVNPYVAYPSQVERIKQFWLNIHEYAVLQLNNMQLNSLH